MLNMVFKPAHNLIFADDGLTFNGGPETIEPKLTLLQPSITPRLGCCYNKRKSGFITVFGSWLKPLKFLGMKYIHSSLLTRELLPNEKKAGGLLFNSSRNPKDFTMNKVDLVNRAVVYKSGADSTQNLSGKTLIVWFIPIYGGLIKAIVYDGKFNLDDVIQDFTFSFHRWSRTALTQELKRLNGEQVDVKMTVFNSASFGRSRVSP
jgi:hypothetical protein